MSRAEPPSATVAAPDPASAGRRSLLTSSVLVPSFGRPEVLGRCLRALARQSVPPGEVIVVWQGDDTPTRDVADRLAADFPTALRVLHLPEPGIVPAENLALDRASGEVVLLIDDDAVAPGDWVGRHLAHYGDPAVGAVGGPAINFEYDGTRYPEHPAEPIGRITWFGRLHGNMYDQPESWRSRPPIEVDHLVGYNMSLRRRAFGRFDESLRRYWQMFEADACLQAKGRGFRVLFDPSIVVEHRQVARQSAYAPGRSGDLGVKVSNSSYNFSYVISKHMPAPRRWACRLYLMAVGYTETPGPLLLPRTIRRHGDPARELAVARLAWSSRLAGWRDGRRARRDARGPAR